MRYLRRSAFLRLVVLPFTLTMWLSACHKWVEVNTTVDSPTELSDPVRVTLNDGQQIDLEEATVTGDSLFGRREGTPRSELGEQQPIRVALGDVASIEEEKRKPVYTVVAVTTLAALAVFTYFMIKGVVELANMDFPSFGGVDSP